MKIIISSIFTLFILKTGYSQIPTYNLTAKNFTLGSINYPYDVLYFDIYLEWTNHGVAPIFELAGQQLYFSFNKDVLSGTWPPGGTSANPDTSQYSYKIVGSDLPSNMLPRNNSLWTASSPTASLLRGAINTFPGSGFGFMVPAGFPGLKIARYRLWNKTSSFRSFDFNIAWRNPPVVAFSTKVFSYNPKADITTSSTHSVDPTLTFSPSFISLNLFCLSEGRYFHSSNQLSSRDTVKVFLRNVSSPYNLIDSSNAVIDSLSFSGLFNFVNAESGRYYIVAKHKQCIETWSRSGGDTLIRNSLTFNQYDFTIAASQAYGSNMILKGTKYCMFSGDINKDNVIDGSDAIRIHTDSFNFVTGPNIITDLNGDLIVDGSDYLIGDNNAFNFVVSVTP